MIQAEPERQPAALAGVVRALRAWGVGGLAAELLEHSGPLSFICAQALYFAAPVAVPFGSGASLMAWAELLEDPQRVEQLAGSLRAPVPGTGGTHEA